MAYNSYFFNVITRLVFLLGTFIALAWLLVNTSRFFTIFFLCLVAMAQVISMVRFLNKTNRDLARFLLLLTAEDSTVIAWKDRVERTFQGLHHSFRQVNEEISRIKLEKEQGSILLQKVIDHIEAGVFVSDEEGVIRLVNEKALGMLNLLSFCKLEDLDRHRGGLASEFLKLRYNSGNILHIGTATDSQLPVMVSVSGFKLGETRLSLYVVQDIKNELEANEIESWQKLTRVLAHEISNSVTPIATLGTGIHRKLSQSTMEKEGGMHIPGDTAADLLQSSELITKRGNALIEFVEHYKSFTRLPDPVLAPADIRTIIDNINSYFKTELTQSGISFHTDIHKEIGKLKLDHNLMEQALINLVRNSIYALEGQDEGSIIIQVRKQGEDEVVLEISDNGPGIPSEIHSQLFIPFFTTKPKGTGIGLSIVKKILNMHGGAVGFQSTEGKGTTFVLRLPVNHPE